MTKDEKTKDMAVGDRHPFYATESLSEHMFTTPEGFLVCADVPITRIGEFIYKPSEVPIKAGDDGLVRILREEEEVFAENTIRSFEGKPVTINHPNDFVTPDNWKDFAHGILQNVRRGEGEQANLMLGDLLLTTNEAINLVRSGLREVSLGYDTQYDQIGMGRGKQKDIIGNHVALVSKGRAGSRCAIMDSDSGCEDINKFNKEDNNEMKKESSKVRDVLRKMFPRLNVDSIKDEDLEMSSEEVETKNESGVEVAQQAAAEAKAAAIEAVEAAKQAASAVAGINNEEVLNEETNIETDEESDEGGDVLSQVNTKLDLLVSKIDSLLDALTEESEEGGEETSEENFEEGGEETSEEGEDSVVAVAVEEAEEDEKEMVQDSIARAEILSPSIVIPKYNSKNVKKVMIEVKRKALSNGLTKDHASIIKPLLRGKKIQNLSLDALDTVFVAASEMVGKVNNSKVQNKTIQMKDIGMSNHNDLANMNKANKEFWNKKK